MNQASINRASNEICSQGFTSIPVTNSMPSIRGAYEGFQSILGSFELQKEFTINPLEYNHDELGEPYEVGLLQEKKGELKIGKAAGFFDKAAGRMSEDAHKHRFHYSRVLRSKLSSDVTLKHEHFLSSLANLNEGALVYTKAIASEIDKRNILLSETDPKKYLGTLSERLINAQVITRLIRYEDIEGSLPDAQVHRDRALFTFHHYASAIGLCLFDKKKQSHHVDEMSPRSLTIFTGEKFWGITRGVFGTGVPHGAIDQRRTAGIHVKKKRFVIVSFVHSLLTKEDQAWIRSHISKIRLNQKQYVIH